MVADTEEGLAVSDASHRTLVPIPDPTTLTGALVRQATDALKAELTARIDGIAKEMSLVQLALNNVPQTIEKAIDHLKELHKDVEAERAKLYGEKFAAIQSRFDGNDKNVDRSLEAQKEVAAKSEALLTKQIDAATDKISDLKDRLNGLGGRDEGKSAARQSNALIIGLIASSVLAGSALVTVIVLLARISHG